MSQRKIQRAFHRPLQLERYALLGSAEACPCSACSFNSSGARTDLHDLDEELTSNNEQDVIETSDMEDERVVETNPFRNITQQSAGTSSCPGSPLPCITSQTSPPGRLGLPYYVYCFSPTRLPGDVIVYLLQFLTAGDLWKLSWASPELKDMVFKYMWSYQTFEFETVRVLHEENHYTPYEWYQLAYERRYEDMQAKYWVDNAAPLQIPRSNPPIHPRAVPGVKFERGEIRNKYWISQADHILSAVVVGTPYETVPSNWRELLDIENSSITTVNGTEEQDDAEDMEDAGTDESEAELEPSTPSPGNSFSQADLTLIENLSSPALSSGYGPDITRALLMKLFRRSIHDQAFPPLPMERLWSMVDILFDPFIVGLDNRRALVNCARYVTSSVESGFGMLIGTEMPVDPTFYMKVMHNCSVSLKPYLKALLPREGSRHAETTPTDQASRVHTRLFPPISLRSYFQAMLWRRCLGDLVALYTRIHVQHTRPAVVSSQQVSVLPPLSRTRGCIHEGQYPQQPHENPTPGPASHPLNPSRYPSCCGFHSGTLDNRQCYRLVPYRACQRVRRVQCISRQSSFMPENARRGLSTSRSFFDKRTRKEANLDDGAMDLEQPGQASNSQGRQCDAREQCFQQQQQERDNREADLVLRRLRLQERIRQDNLVKQELLSLCHMACGLFVIRASPNTPRPRTIMTHLRQGSPWQKGVWREGQWRYAPIDLDHDLDEAAMSHRLDLEQQAAEGLPRWNNSATLSEVRARLDGLFNFSEGYHGIEGEDDINDQGPWQKLCLATIQFLIDEHLEWAGGTKSEELNRLRVTEHTDAWYYYE